MGFPASLMPDNSTVFVAIIDPMEHRVFLGQEIWSVLPFILTMCQEFGSMRGIYLHHLSSRPDHKILTSAASHLKVKVNTNILNSPVVPKELRYFHRR